MPIASTTASTVSTTTAAAITTMGLGLLQQHLLQLTPLFRSYPKTIQGFACFLREMAMIRLSADAPPIAALSIADIITIRLGEMAALRALLRPFYHCAWDTETQRAMVALFEGDDAATVDHPLLRQLLTDAQAIPPAVTAPPPSPMHEIPRPPVLLRQDGNHRTPSAVTAPATPLPLTLQQVPDDWRDLVEGLMARGKLRLADYSSLEALERYVDEAFELTDTGRDYAPVEVARPAAAVAAAAPAKKAAPVVRTPARAAVHLPQEEREAIAEALQLRTTNFRTKEEALALYLQKQAAR